MAMNWYEYVKKYVWDEKKTPYFVKVDKLTKSQARSELFVYTLFLAILFGIIAAVLLSENGRAEGFRAVALGYYAFTVLCAAVALGGTKHLYAALYCVAAPVGAFLSIVYSGLRPDLATIDKYALLVVTLIWLRYAVRVVAIAKGYERMPEPADDA